MMPLSDDGVPSTAYAPQRPTSASGLADTVMQAARDNPVAGVLIGIGLVSMFIDMRAVRAGADVVQSGARAGADAVQSGARAVGRSGSNIAAGVRQSVADGYQSVSRGVSAGVRSAANTVAAGSDAATRLGHDLRDQAGRLIPSSGSASQDDEDGSEDRDFRSYALDQSREALDQSRLATGALQSAITDLWERQPLSLGVLGVAIGSGLAAALSVSDFERDLLSGPAATLKDTVQHLASEHIDKGRSVLDAATHEIQAQGLTVDALKQTAGTLKDKVARVAGAVTSEPST